MTSSENNKIPEEVQQPDSQPVENPVVDDEEMPAALRDDDKTLGTQILQFFLFPVMIVVAAMAVIVIFGVSASGKSSVDDLLLDLSQGSSYTRKQAAYRLAKKLTDTPELAKEPVVAESLLDLLNTKSEMTAEMRQYLMLAGSMSGDERFTPLILRELDEFYKLGEGDQDARQLEEATLYNSLANLADASTLDFLEEKFQRDDEATRMFVVEAISPIDHERSTELLVKALEDSYSDVRWNAALRLAAAPRLNPAASPTIAKLLDREYVESAPEITPSQVRDWMVTACRAAGTLAAEDLREPLQKLADGDPDIRVQGEALAALDQLKK